MAKYINAVEAAEAVSQKTGINLGDLVDIFAEIPRADVVPVVRCRDCKHSCDDLGGLTCSYGVCVDCIVPPNFFCSFGERKEAKRNEKSD